MDMHYPYQLPPLPYAYEALSPNISGDTLHFHHDKHFQTYVDNLNTALADCPECQSKPLDELLKNLDRLPDPKRTAIRNNGGGVYNHLLYFDGMCACDSSRPSGGLAMAMERDFGSFEGWKEQMKAAALGQFGSGYAWLVSETSGKLSVMMLPNQDCPLSMGLWPVLCLDVWEHAYYLDYQNRRAEYVDRWFERVNWPFAAGGMRCRQQTKERRPGRRSSFMCASDGSAPVCKAGTAPAPWRSFRRSGADRRGCRLPTRTGRRPILR